MADAGSQKDSALNRATFLGCRKPPRLERSGTSCDETEHEQPPHGASVPRPWSNATKYAQWLQTAFGVVATAALITEDTK